MVDTTIQTIKTHKEVGMTVPKWNTKHKRTTKNNNVNISKQCYKCGNQYNQAHLQYCPAKDKLCSKCAKRGHFGKVCRSTNVNCSGNRQDEQQEVKETESLETENDPVAFAESTSNNGCEEYQIDKFSVMAIAESLETKNTIIL